LLKGASQESIQGGVKEIARASVLKANPPRGGDAKPAGL
jgi:hypothetical protein